MQLNDLLAQVQDQLSATAGLGDERTQQIAATLATAATPSVQLAIMSALAMAADEITVALLDYPGAPAVTVRFDGDQVYAEVRTHEPQLAQSAARPDDGDASARISLRLPESLKADIEQAAARDGVSVNTWLVRATSAALAAPNRPTDWPGGPRLGPGVDPDRRGRSSHHVTGWIAG